MSVEADFTRREEYYTETGGEIQQRETFSLKQKKKMNNRVANRWKGKERNGKAEKNLKEERNPRRGRVRFTKPPTAEQQLQAPATERVTTETGVWVTHVYLQTGNAGHFVNIHILLL